ncbi:hypothetical protein O181_017851 [Austropuccinia psidii MF-1]|uniref:Uncharacterized protein n=1 Tax=Austropuccinia psidii MF-1 TaxID=1389203 RepID=A0A9Q3GSD1_9BASI|nr:hypothetical protein [Austropuccinia psidii MF-1]
MRFLNPNSHAQPTAGSLSGHTDAKPIQKAILERDKLIAQLLQQAEAKEPAKENPWGSNSQKTDKRKGHRIIFEDQVCNTPKAHSHTKKSKQTRSTQRPQVRPASSVRRNPIQMLMQDAPPDFKYTKVQSVLQNSQGVKLINEAQVQTLRDARSWKRKIGENIINMQDLYITYVHAMLAKLGIGIWEADLEEAPNSMYNEVCRVVALMKFCQIACSGAYQYMWANLTYCGYLGLLRTAYYHYVHYVLPKRYKKESLDQGCNEREVEKKVVQRARLRLDDWHYKFLVAHNYVKRYQIIASDVNEHSDDGYNAMAGVYVIKTLAHQSENATAFFHQLDCKIKDVEAMMGRGSNQQICWRTTIPIISEFKKTPKNFPIDFYLPEWFKDRDHSEKLMAADLSEVAFVPVKDLPPMGKKHPNERLGDISFNYKYWDLTIKDYKIEPRTPDSSERNSNAGDLSYYESGDLDTANPHHDVDNHLVTKQIIELERGEIELEPEEHNKEFEESQEAGGDVIISDAWDYRGRESQHSQMDYYEEHKW